MKHQTASARWFKRASLVWALTSLCGALGACSVVYNPDKLGAGCPAGTQDCGGKCLTPEAAATSGHCGDISCAPNEYELASACVPLTTCSETEYEASPPSAQSDRSCSPITDCAPGQFVTADATAANDRQCAPCTDGTFSAVSDAPVCGKWSVCGAGETESAAPDATKDRVCGQCGQGQYAKAGHCQAISVCAPGQFIAQESTTASDRQCSPCANGTFSDKINQTQCTAWSACVAGQSESTPPSNTSDRVCGVAQANEFETGLWRLVARTDRHTLTRSSTTGLLVGANYGGNSRQQFRLRRLGDASYEFTIESTKECLLFSGSAVLLGACGNAAQAFTVESLRARSVEQPALYRLHASGGTCMNPNGEDAPTLGGCTNAADWYLEPVGFGERSEPVEYELHARLIVKTVTDVVSPAEHSSHATIPQDISSAGQLLFTRDMATWFRKMTDGRVQWLADSVISPDPLTALTKTRDGDWVPFATNVAADVQRYLPRGTYDAATVFFLSRGDANGGWVTAPGISSDSNYTMWGTVNGGDAPAAQWLTGESDTTEVYIWEVIAGLNGFFSTFHVPLPEKQLDDAGGHGYAQEENNWAPWYRDYLLGTVIETDDTYRGFGSRAFRFGTPRAQALTP